MDKTFLKKALSCICAAALILCFCVILPSPAAFAGNTGSVDMPQTIAGGNEYSAAITEDGKLMMWGNNFFGFLSAESSGDDLLNPTEIMQNAASVYVSNESSANIAVIKTDGTLWTWGLNDLGQLGNGSTTDSKVPQQIMTEAAAAAVGFKHCAAIKKDGSLWTWGLNNYGQLGDGKTENLSEPKKIMDGVVSVSLGQWHSAAVKDDGSLWIWGNNNYGQLGNGTKENCFTPQKVLDNVAFVQVREFFTAAVKKDGTLWMCGSNNNRELGYDADRNSPVFQQVLDDVKCVNLGNRYTLALKNNGELWGWGCGGALGDGYINSINYPEKIMEGVNSIAAGYDHSLILKDDGALLSCGRNYYGQLGDGNHKTNDWTLTPSPVKIGKVKTVDKEPTASPTPEPTATPTPEPTSTPTAEPTATPTAEPTSTPTAEPTATPTAEPTATPTPEPTSTPTAEPTATPTAEPTATPTAEPTATPTAEPTATPTAEPTATPTAEPTATPTAEPTATPTAEPTATTIPEGIVYLAEPTLDLNTVTAHILNNSGENAVFIAAVYDGGDSSILKDVKIVNLSEGDSGVLTLSLNISKGDIVKAFLWNGNLSPAARATEIRN